MRTIWQSLLWKEWYEHKWRMAALAAIYCGLVLVALLSSNNRHDGFGAALYLPIVVCAPLAIFVGAGTAASERSRGTLGFLQALPVPLWRVALHKLALGLLTLIVPSLLVTGLIAAVDRWLDVTNLKYDLTPLGVAMTPYWLAHWGVVLLGISVSIFIWTVAAGARRSDEISAGATALLTMVGWWVGLLVIGTLWIPWGAPVQNDSEIQWLLNLGIATAPVGFIVANIDPSNLYVREVLLISFGMHALLVACFVGRFHNNPVNLAARSPRYVPRAFNRRDWLRPPFASPRIAVVWKQARESGPLALAGLGGILGVFAIAAISIWFDQRELGPRLIRQLVEAYAGVSVALGVFIALVAGVGVALNDSGAKANAFWRSRPIDPDLWYWTKFFTGLTVLLAALYGPMLLLAAMLLPQGLLGLWHADAPFFFPPLHVALFATSLALTCILRQAIYAAVLSIGVVYLGMLPTMLMWRGEPPPLAAAISLFVIAAVMALVGWLAMRNDWGWRWSGR